MEHVHRWMHLYCYCFKPSILFDFEELLGTCQWENYRYAKCWLIYLSTTYSVKCKTCPLFCYKWSRSPPHNSKSDCFYPAYFILEFFFLINFNAASKLKMNEKEIKVKFLIVEYWHIKRHLYCCPCKLTTEPSILFEFEELSGLREF